jgi:four helix bundle protein
MLRASISIPSNVAEGAERKSVPDFQRFINIAQSSAAELRTQLYISREIEILPKNKAHELIEDAKTISKRLQSLHKLLNKKSTNNRKSTTVNHKLFSVNIKSKTTFKGLTPRRS